ncbi:MAG TPA: hypothetical protein VLS89_20235, partial [Candidatus Nanopelagicales bacterium]|nr:hypothetical protein [Candidatus Nanopelagicales bacterium]
MKRPAFILLVLILFALFAPGAALSHDFTFDGEIDIDRPTVFLPPAPPIPLDIPPDSLVPADPAG